MFLCIDQGNSSTKAGIFDAEGLLVKKETFRDVHLQRINELAGEYQVTHVIISTTGNSDWNSNEIKADTVIVLDQHTSLPISILYSTPGTLGHDRIAAACATYSLYPNRNCLIIDAGTCITMDLLLSKGIFIGGNIAPGIIMRIEAMHEKTARLPKAPPAFPELPFGDSTIHALQNGACLGAVMEIEGILNRAKKAYGDVIVVITGGDAALLATKLECQIFVEPELVIQGLFQILSFNVKNSN